MKLAGFFLAAGRMGHCVVRTGAPSVGAARAVFVVAGVGVEILGFALVARSHPAHPQEGW